MSNLKCTSIVSFLVLLAVTIWNAEAQPLLKEYYLPDITYDESIPTPLEVVGHDVGEWHITHDKLVFYMRELARNSDRISIHTYGHTHEGRPLIQLIITSPENHLNLETLRKTHFDLTLPEQSKNIDIKEVPIVIYQGMSVHGNEASGANGSLAYAYFLAAGKDNFIDSLMHNSIVILDPSFNPDGLQRFSTWVNMHKGKHMTTDPQSREFSETWPGGRTNHYWFDLNRDWIFAVHPESKARAKVYHEWMPDILTDHHEMGSDYSFFFQPGIPSRTNPLTSNLNQELTEKIGVYHAERLDQLGSLYYSKDSYDDFYYGKGAAYPDIQGGIGILFEQASARGHVRQTPYGEMSFPFTIRNQVSAMISTAKAGLEMRMEILEYKRQSFVEAIDLAEKDNIKGFVFTSPEDPARSERFIHMLQNQHIDIHKLASSESLNGNFYPHESSFVVPLKQRQYKLIKTIFETSNDFQDSLFYDVSSWTVPLAYNLTFDPIEEKINSLTGEKLAAPYQKSKSSVQPTKSPYAYIIRWNQLYAPRALQELLENDITVMVAGDEFTLNTGEEFGRGTLVIPLRDKQGVPASFIDSIVQHIVKDAQIEVNSAGTGQVTAGINLGNRVIKPIQPVKPLLVVGSGTRSYSAGEIWHHFDTEIKTALPMIEVNKLSSTDLSEYTTIILPDGSYEGSLSEQGKALGKWIREGGHVIAIDGALQWLSNQGILTLQPKVNLNIGESDKTPPAYGSYDNESRAMRTTGAIVRLDIDKTHPLFYGYQNSFIPLMKRENDFYRPLPGKYDTPGRFKENAVISGYMHISNRERMEGSAGTITTKVGEGRITGHVDDILFRGYWLGAHRLFANSLYFSQLIR
jgi:hypothetical protein